MKPYWKYPFTDWIGFSTTLFFVVGFLGLYDADPTQDPTVWWLWIIFMFLSHFGWYIKNWLTYKKNNP